jgi:fumarate reductase subunit D
MKISGSERFMAALGYLAILFLIPVKMRRDSMFVQFHARQGGVLFGLYLLICLVLVIVLLFAGGTGIFVTILLGALFAATFVYIAMAVIGLLKVALGERYRMPLVADVALLLRL